MISLALTVVIVARLRSIVDYLPREENERNNERALALTRQTLMRILLADDQEVVRRALRLLLEQETNCIIVGEVQDADELRAAVRRGSPDLILLDWELPGLETDRLLPVANGEGTLIRVIAMSSRPEAQTAARSAGVDACISKGRPAEEVLAAIYTVVGDED